MSPKEIEPHKRYPRSSFFYAMSNCEAAFQLSIASGEDPPTLFSDRGTDVHGVIYGKLPRADVEEGIGEEAEYLERLHQMELNEWLDPEGGDLLVVREKRLWLRKGMRPYYSGQPDDYTIQGRRVFLADYKTGWHPLDDFVATNCQIRAYVPLINADLNGELDEVTATIHKPGKRSPPAVFDRAAIEEATQWAIAVAITAVSKGKKTPNRGPWCKYCSGKVLCPLWREELVNLADLSTAIVSDIPDSALRAMAPSLSLAHMVAEKLLERLYARVQANPTFFSDWRFEDATPKRKIEDTVEAYNELVVKTQALTPGEFLTACRLTIGELEKRIRLHGALSANQTKALLDELLGRKKIMTRSKGKPQLVYDPKPTALPE